MANMKILLFSSLFPNSARPSLGVFVENRLCHLIEDTGIEAKVIAPIPFFPFKNKIFGKYADYARAPRFDMRDGVEIYYPRYFHLPVIGAFIQSKMMAWAGIRAAKKLIKQGYDFDVIDAHYLYPDGVAASEMSQAVGKPFTMTARGSDVTEIFPVSPYDARITDAAKVAGKVMTVSESLRQGLIAGGVDGAKVETLRNGVDTAIFYPDGFETARERVLQACGIETIAPDSKLFLSVGWLITRKRNHLMVDAMVERPNDHFIMIGDGPERRALESQAQKLNVADRVHFLGQKEHKDLRLYLSGVDILTLMSDREGWPNVLLEAMACGTPVVSTNAGGVSEFVNVPVAGRVVFSDKRRDILTEIDQLLSHYPLREDVVAYAERFSWLETSLKQEAIFEALVKKHDAPPQEG